MKKIRFGCHACLFLCILILSSCSESGKSLPQQTHGLTNDTPVPQRIVSTVPSITEILFDIGAGDRLVGDSSFTKYPPETQAIPKIGGLYDLNMEALVSQKPDLVITLEENAVLQERLKAFGVEILRVDHRSLDGILESYDTIGRRLGTETQAVAHAKKQQLAEKMQAFSRKNAAFTPVPVLLCVDRLRGTGRIQGLYVVGTSPFYQDMIRLGGGKNVAERINLPFPTLSAEGIAELAPEVIIELFTGDAANPAAGTITPTDENAKKMLKTARRDWKTVDADVPAIKNGQIYIITDDFATIPGPRTPLLVEKLSSILEEYRSRFGR